MATGTREMALDVPVNIRINSASFHRDMVKMGDELTQTVDAALAAATDGAFSKDAVKKYESYFNTLRSKTEAALGMANEFARKAQDKNLSEITRKQLQADADRLKALGDATQAQLAKEAKATEAMGRRKEKGIEIAGEAGTKMMTVGFQQAAEGFHETFSAFISKDVGQMGGMLKRLGQQTKTVGGALASKETAGSFGKMAGGAGELLMKLGPIIASVGAIVAGFAAVIKIIIDADSATKELNRGLLDAGMAGQDLADKFGGVGDQMDAVVKTFTSAAGALDFNRMWGTTAQDHLKILGAYAEAGMSFKQIKQYAGEGAEQVNALRDATQAALVYSKLLGVSQTEIATTMADYMDGLAMTMKGVEERFSGVGLAAGEAGYSTKKFFGVVTQATSSLGLYNARVEDTAGLLNQLRKSLGKKGAIEFLEGFMKGFKDSTTKDLIPKVMLAGFGGKPSKQFMTSAKIGVGESFRKLGDMKPEAASKFWEQLGKQGIKQGMGAEDRFAKFAGMDEAQINEMGRLLSDDFPDMFNSMKEAWRDAKAATTGGLGAAATSAQRTPQNAFITKLFATKSAQLPFGGRALHEIPWEEIMKAAEKGVAVQTITGMTMKELQDTQDAMRPFVEKATTLQMTQKDYLKSIKEGTDPKVVVDTFNQKWGSKYGIHMTDKGKFFKMVKRNGVLDQAATEKGLELDADAVDLFQKVGEGIAASAKPQVSEDLEKARVIADKTTEMTKLLEQGVQWFLKHIDENVSMIADLMPGTNKSLTDEQKATKQGIISAINTSSIDVRKQLGKEEKELRDLNKQMDDATEEQKKELKPKIEAKEKTIAGLNARSEALEKERDAISKMHRQGAIAPAGGDFRKAASITGDVPAAQRKLLQTTLDPAKAAKAEIAAAQARTAEEEKVALVQKVTSIGKDIASAVVPGVGIVRSANKVLGWFGRGWQGQELTPEEAGLQKEVETMRAAMGEGQAPAGDTAKDFVVSRGRVTKFDPGDTVVGGKAGGPVAKGGGNTYVFHVYDGQNVINKIRDAQLAGII